MNFRREVLLIYCEVIAYWNTSLLLLEEVFEIDLSEFKLLEDKE